MGNGATPLPAAMQKAWEAPGPGRGDPAQREWRNPGARRQGRRAKPTFAAQDPVFDDDPGASASAAANARRISRKKPPFRKFFLFPLASPCGKIRPMDS